MLLEFRLANYKSFLMPMLFSLLPAPKQKGLDTSVLRLHCGHGDCRGLASAVVYGPNAAGKTTIVGAMDTLRSIVRRGNIRNVASSRNPNAASESLELIPNNTLTEPRPVELGIRFTADGLCLDYSLSLALGLFLSADMAARRVQQERLLVNLRMPVRKLAGSSQAGSRSPCKTGPR